MDKFGAYRRGARGPAGPAGRDALELHNWFPKGILRLFRESEACTFYFNTPKDGIFYEEGKPKGLKDRGGRRNAICIQNFINPMKIGKLSPRYGIRLNESLYKIAPIITAITPKSILFIALTFKVTTPTEENGFIFSNTSGTRAVTINKKALNISGSKTPQDLTYNYRGWNTLMIQYSRVTEDGDDQCFFVLNEQRGFFRPRKYDIPDEEIFIGGHPKKRDYANIVIGNFEVYNKEYTETPTKYLVPEEIYNLIQTEIEVI